MGGCEASGLARIWRGGNLVKQFLAAGCGLLLAASAAHGQATWAQRLGYPADAKVVILYGQGLGTCQETNAAIEELLSAGQLQSAGSLAPAPWFDAAAAHHTESGDGDIGLSLAMTSTWPLYRWQPVAGREAVKSLCDADGFLTTSLLQLSMNANADEVAAEVEAQITRAREAGIQPSHLMPYEGAMLARSDFLEIYLNVSRKHWIPAVLVELTPEHIRQFREAGLPLSDEEVRLITNYPLPKLDDLRFSPEADTLEAKREGLLNEIATLQPGLTQVMFRPAHDSEALRELTPDWQQRVWDAELLADPALAEALEEHGVILTSWEEIMQRFEGVQGQTIEAEEEAAAEAEEAELEAAGQGE